MDLAKLIERAKGICLSPKAEWPKIAAETTDVKSLYVGYAAILALIPAICGFIGMTVIGVSMPIVGTIRTPIAAGLAQLIIGYVLGLGVIYLVGMIVNALAPTFSGEKNLIQALKLVIPGIVNSFISLFKDTSLVFIMGLYDLLNISRLIVTGQEWLGKDVESYIFAGFGFWIFCFAMSRFSQRLERKLQTGHKH